MFGGPPYHLLVEATHLWRQVGVPQLLILVRGLHQIVQTAVQYFL
jgi:hypothetical protein